VLHDTAMGGGVFQHPSIDERPTFVISDSIVAGNTAASGSVGADLVKDSESTLTLIYSVIGFLPPEGTGGILSWGSFTGVPAMLAPLADNGGPTQTHMPLPGSPAMNNGNPMFNPADPDGNPATNDAVLYDQRGAPYVRLSGGRVDIGAVEFQPPPGALFVGDYNLNGVVDAADYVMWRKTLGTTGLPAYSGADGDGDGTVDADDCDVWEANFGEASSGSGGGQATASVDSGNASLAGDEPMIAKRHSDGGTLHAAETLHTDSERNSLDRIATPPPVPGVASVYDDALIAWLTLRGSRGSDESIDGDFLSTVDSDAADRAGIDLGGVDALDAALETDIVALAVRP
jgi:hypothetical protein